MNLKHIRVPTALRLFWAAIKGWSSDNVPRLGASLAYYTLFAIAPILIIAIAIAGSIFGAEAVRGEIVAQLDQLIGTEGARAVQALPRSLASAHNLSLTPTPGCLIPKVPRVCCLRKKAR